MGLQSTYLGVLAYLQANLNTGLPANLQIKEFLFGNANPNTGNYPNCLITFSGGRMEPQTTSIFRSSEEMFLVFNFSNASTSDILQFLDYVLIFAHAHESFGQPNITHIEETQYGWGKDISGNPTMNNNNLLSVVLKIDIEVQLGGS